MVKYGDTKGEVHEIPEVKCDGTTSVTMRTNLTFAQISEFPRLYF